MTTDQDGIKARIKNISSTLPEWVELAAVSKFHSPDAVRAAYDAGQRIFCESRAAELAMKAAQLPDDIQWHFIGHLQSNKIKLVVPYAHTIQSIDSEKLLRAIDAEASRTGRHINVLLQVHVAAEESKYGLTPRELTELAERTHGSLTNVTVTGIMGMATNTDSEQRINADFEAIRSLFHNLKTGIMAGNPDFRVLSMGMSHDYHLAIAHGSTMVRIGTSIFGEREY